MEKDTRRLALISVGLGIGIVTLLPVQAGLIHAFRPGVPESLGTTLLDNLLAADLFDIIQNILLYLPLGYLAAAGVSVREGAREGARAEACEGAPAGRRILKAGILGLGLSTVMEGLQLWIPGRFCSVLDVLTNGTGAWLGGMAVLATPVLADRIFSGAVLPD